MSRSPLAYPLNRSVDGDAGGAADLQTDIMRFMAILALCLVAIFALVQSIPMAPQRAEPETVPTTPQPIEQTVVVAPSDPVTVPEPAPSEPQQVVLTRPKRQPRPQPAFVTEAEPTASSTSGFVPATRGRPCSPRTPTRPPTSQIVPLALRLGLGRDLQEFD